MKTYVTLKKPASVKSEAIRAEITKLIKSGKKTNEIYWKMDFITTDKIAGEIASNFQVLKNRIAFENYGKNI